MASIGFHFWKIGAWFRISNEEAREAAVPALFVVSTVVFAGISGKLIYDKVKAGIDSQLDEDKCKHKFHYSREKKADDNGECSNGVNDGAIGKEQNGKEPEPMLSLKTVVTSTKESVIYLATNALRLGGALVIFGPKGVGKSTLTMMLAQAIAEGELCDALPIDNVVKLPPQIVFYYDLEMVESQMKARYGNNPELIPENLRWKYILFNSANEWLDDVEYQTSPSRLNQDATIIIDNITKCGTGLTQPDVVTKMTKRINDMQTEALKRGIHLSFVFVAHTTQLEQKDKPISTNDLAGSANLGNFPDTIVGVSKTKIEKHILAKMFNNRNHPEPGKVLLLENLGTAPNLSFGRKDWAEEDKVLPNKNGKTISYSGYLKGCANPVHNGHKKKYTDEQVEEFDRLVNEEKYTYKEAEEKVGMPYQTYQKRRKPLLEEGTIE